jgi:hypothetical protein
LRTTSSDIVPFKITVCGIEELGDHCDIGVSHVLSILDPGAPEPPVFGSFGEHERVELRFDDVIDDSPDQALPSAGMSNRSSPSAAALVPNRRRVRTCSCIATQGFLDRRQQ